MIVLGEKGPSQGKTHSPTTRKLSTTYNSHIKQSSHSMQHYYVLPLKGGGIKRCFCLTPVCRVHRA